MPLLPVMQSDLEAWSEEQQEWDLWDLASGDGLKRE
jgi:hypothetical protein